MKLKILFWIPRVLVIVSILFLMVFSLDEFGGDDPFGKKLLGFLVHNIPAFIMIITLIIAWKYEIKGGVLFILIFFALGIFFKSFSGNPASLVVIAPLLMAGIMFVLHEVLSKRNYKSQQD